VLKPGAKWWPGWADCYNNLRWVPQIQSPVIILHVRPPKLLSDERRMTKDRAVICLQPLSEVPAIFVC